MKTILYSFTLFFILLSFCNSQTKKESLKAKKIVEIDNVYKLGFMQYESNSGLYKSPIIIKNNKSFEIYEYNIDNYSDGNIISVSPNHKYIVLDYIIRDYVNEGNQKKL